ncbi:RecT family recombinase [Brevibacillus laterosporus]|uniref:RecT family recombinase n=1 Tax=Brevibacillus laterosporus TaxID=1465 RepID=UPI002E1D169A|nr:recombinase RecT [Brevibacillus laterosporus]MED1670325.1 recombinase RecT [Brevibacillus laterosporus]MED1717880.1 recombinase RecT [Brevibacillus laterosporus]
MTQLQTVTNQPNVLEFTKEKRDLLINTIAKGATPHELELFINVCQSSELNPFLNQIYFIKYGDKVNIQISVEGIQTIARRREDYDGFTAEVVKENDSFQADVSAGEVSHKVESFVRGKTIGAYCVARRKGFKPVVILVGRDETKALETGNNKTLWTNYYDDMIRKHAIKRALKLQFGIEIGEDDVVQDNISNIPAYQGEAQIIDTDGAVITPKREKPTKTIEVEEGETINEEDALKQAWAEVKEIQTELDMDDKNLIAFIKEKTKKTAKALSLSEVTGLKKVLKLELVQKSPVNASNDEFDNIFDSAE